MEILWSVVFYVAANV